MHIFVVVLSKKTRKLLSKIIGHPIFWLFSGYLAVFYTWIAAMTKNILILHIVLRIYHLSASQIKDHLCADCINYMIFRTAFISFHEMLFSYSIISLQWEIERGIPKYFDKEVTAFNSFQWFQRILGQREKMDMDHPTYRVVEKYWWTQRLKANFMMNTGPQLGYCAKCIELYTSSGRQGTRR